MLSFPAMRALRRDPAVLRLRLVAVAILFGTAGLGCTGTLHADIPDARVRPDSTSGPRDAGPEPVDASEGDTGTAMTDAGPPMVDAGPPPPPDPIVVAVISDLNSSYGSET